MARRKEEVHAWLRTKGAFAEDEADDEEEREGRNGDGRQRGGFAQAANSAGATTGAKHALRGIGERGIP